MSNASGIMHCAFLIMHFSLVWKHPRDLPRVDVSDRCRSAQAPLPLPGLVAEDVLLEGVAAQKLAVLGPLEALGGAAVRFEFDLLRHETKSLSL
jgi:hypothetical protein